MPAQSSQDSLFTPKNLMAIGFTILAIVVAIVVIGKTVQGQQGRNLGPLGGGSPNGAPGLKSQMTPNTPTDTGSKAGSSGQ